MREQEEALIQQLPSIGFDTPKEDLFAMYMQLATLHSKDQNTEQTHFSNYFHVSLAVNVGIPISLTDVRIHLSAFLAETPRPENVDIYAFWYSLKNRKVQLPYDEIASRWRQSIAKIKNQSQAMSETLSYLAGTKQDDAKPETIQQRKKVIQQMARTIRHFLPPATQLSQTKIDEYDNIITVSRYVCSWAKELGIQQEVQDIDNHLTQTLQLANVEDAYALNIELLLYHVLDSTALSKEQKQQLVTRLALQTTALDPGDKKDTLLGVLAHSFLQLDSYSQAVCAWQDIKSYTEADMQLKQFIIWHARHQTTSRIRELYPVLKQKFKATYKYLTDEDFKSYSVSSWIFASISLADEHISLLREPEMIRAVQEESTYYLNHLIRLSKTFPDELFFKELVETRMRDLMQLFNRGKLTHMYAHKLIEALLHWNSSL